MPKLFNKKLPAIFAIASILLLAGFYYSSKIYSEMHSEIKLSQTETIVFSRGSSIRTLANQLIEKNILKEKRYFLIWGKLNRQETRLQAGEYLIAPGSTLVELLENMVNGDVIQHDIALIEGLTFRQMLQTIHENPVIT
ncbi:MAG: endolytic transglycosylase MltG, partial [Gammaproteobacteria bacterium]|nr:endolytic transglycosylase MltG [Gammaproteobacteria bacterium]